VPLRIGFDLDGVLADMDGELMRHAEAIFGEASVRRLAIKASNDNGPRADASPEVPGAAAAEDAPDGSAAKGSDHDVSSLQLTARQERRLWRRVGSIENFWETLQEVEPGITAQLARLAAERRWEIIFLTKRPSSAGATAQTQSQRWLSEKGFNLPSVFVVQGSRGRIAAALGLDFVVDDRPENCLDVVVDSRARAILVWRVDQGPPPPAAKRLGIGIVTSVEECLSILAQLDARPEEPKVIDRVMRLLGLREPV
jgi:hypothetical protein